MVVDRRVRRAAGSSPPAPRSARGAPSRRTSSSGEAATKARSPRPRARPRSRRRSPAPRAALRDAPRRRAAKGAVDGDLERRARSSRSTPARMRSTARATAGLRRATAARAEGDPRSAQPAPGSSSGSRRLRRQPSTRGFGARRQLPARPRRPARASADDGRAHVVATAGDHHLGRPARSAAATPDRAAHAPPSGANARPADRDRPRAQRPVRRVGDGAGQQRPPGGGHAPERPGPRRRRRPRCPARRAPRRHDAARSREIPVLPAGAARGGAEIDSFGSPSARRVTATGAGRPSPPRAAHRGRAAWLQPGEPRP